MEKESITEAKRLNTAIICDCGKLIPTLKLGAPIAKYTDAILGEIHRIPSLDELDPDCGIIAQSYVFMCPHCGQYHLVDERYKVCGYVDRTREQDMFGNTEYYTYDEYRVTDVYTVSADGMTVDVPVDDRIVPDPKMEIDSFLKLLFRTEPAFKGKTITIEHEEDVVILAVPKGNTYEIFVQKTNVTFD